MPASSRSRGEGERREDYREHTGYTLHVALGLQLAGRRLSQDTVKDRIKACNVFHILFSVKIGFAAFYSKIEIQVETNSNSLLENN